MAGRRQKAGLALIGGHRLLTRLLQRLGNGLALAHLPLQLLVDAHQLARAVLDLGSQLLPMPLQRPPGLPIQGDIGEGNHEALVRHRPERGLYDGIARIVEIDLQRRARAGAVDPPPNGRCHLAVCPGAVQQHQFDHTAYRHAAADGVVGQIEHLTGASVPDHQLLINVENADALRDIGDGRGQERRTLRLGPQAAGFLLLHYAGDIGEDAKHAAVSGADVVNLDDAAIAEAVHPVAAR